jgi:hypothetical protein
LVKPWRGNKRCAVGASAFKDRRKGPGGEAVARVVGENADCQRDSKARVSRSESLAERGAEMTRTQYRGDEGTLEMTRGRGQGAALAVGVRSRSGDTTTRMTRRPGVWTIGLFLQGKISPLDMASVEEGHKTPGSIQS